jgi:hypothetical protein
MDVLLPGGYQSVQRESLKWKTTVRTNRFNLPRFFKVFYHSRVMSL